MPILSIRHEFVPQVIEGTKKMHIHEDPTEQWSDGRHIYFHAGNPRVKKNNPYKLGFGIVKSAQYIQIFPAQNKVLLQGVNIADLQAFAALNGFDTWAKMKAYFEHSFVCVAITWDSIEIYEPQTLTQNEQNKDKLINNLRAQLAFAQSEINRLKNNLKISC